MFTRNPKENGSWTNSSTFLALKNNIQKVEQEPGGVPESRVRSEPQTMLSFWQRPGQGRDVGGRGDFFLKKKEEKKSRALPVDTLLSSLLILLFRNPHLLEGPLMDRKDMQFDSPGEEQPRQEDTGQEDTHTKSKITVKQSSCVNRKQFLCMNVHYRRNSVIKKKSLIIKI